MKKQLRVAAAAALLAGLAAACSEASAQLSNKPGGVENQDGAVGKAPAARSVEPQRTAPVMRDAPKPVPPPAVDAAPKTSAEGKKKEEKK